MTVRQGDAAASRFCNATGAVCPILIAVFNANIIPGSVANFTVSASPGGSQQPLQSGVPVAGQLAAGDASYYSLAAGVADGSAMFAVTPLAGDPDLYVSSSRLGAAGRFPNPANPASYCWSSANLGRDVVEIFPDDTSPCYCNLLPCTYFVAVVAFPPATAVFTLVAQDNLNNSITLLDGVPQNGFVAQGSTVQFVYAVAPTAPASAPSPFSSPPRTIAVALTSLAGDSDVFVTLDGSTPTLLNWAYRSTTDSGVDFVAIRQADAAVQASPGCADARLTCLVRLAVFGFSPGVAWFQLSGAAGRALVLADGVEVEDAADAGGFAYFTFQVNDAGAALTITVTPTSGDPDVFVSANASAPWPTDAPGSWQWSSAGSGVEVVDISPLDPAAARCGAPCTYVIAVQAWGAANASFVISAATRDGRPTALSPLLPASGRVQQGQYARFTAAFDRAAGFLEVVLTPVSGDADLYGALDGRLVTNANWSYAATSGAGAVDSFVVRATDAAFNASAGCGRAPVPRGAVCTASIAVFGFSDAEFVITASAGLRPLADGVPTTGQSAGGAFTYFVYTQVNRFTPLVIQVDPISGDPDSERAPRRLSNASRRVPTRPRARPPPHP